MKTNNIASYTDVLVTCMRQNPIWILLAEVRSAEAVLAIRNSISSGHHIMSTIHADKAASIPMRMYSLLESSQDTEQFLSSIHRYVQLGIYVKGYMSKRHNRFQREILEVCEFYVDEDNNPCTNQIYKKSLDGTMSFNNPTQHLKDYCSIQGIVLGDDPFHLVTDKTETNNLKNPLEEQTPTASNGVAVENNPVAQQVQINPVENNTINQQTVMNSIKPTVENSQVINSQSVNANNNQINNISNINSIDVLDVI